MEVVYSIKNALKASKSDLIIAMRVYLDTVDEGSQISTNEIQSYLLNKFDKNENRKMFFYIFYVNNEVNGFAEFAYLPKSRTIFIDYLCTKQRNHLLFYNFYKLTLEEILSDLSKKQLFPKYIVTELSTRKIGNKLTDYDSNYFRQLLTLEKFKQLNIPYYQPSLGENNKDQIIEFNLALKIITNTDTEYLVFNEPFYLSLIKEIYFEHYDRWFSHFPQYYQNIHLDQLYKKVKQQFPNNIEEQNISLVNCFLFELGKCKQISSENITIGRKRKKKLSKFFSLIFSILTFFVCLQFGSGKMITSICSFITIIPCVISFFKGQA